MLHIQTLHFYFQLQFFFFFFKSTYKSHHCRKIDKTTKYIGNCMYKEKTTLHETKQKSQCMDSQKNPEMLIRLCVSECVVKRMWYVSVLTQKRCSPRVMCDENS